MSMYSDYTLDEVEYHNMCVQENMRDRYEQEREEQEDEQDDIEG